MWLWMAQKLIQRKNLFILRYRLIKYEVKQNEHKSVVDYACQNTKKNDPKSDVADMGNTHGKDSLLTYTVLREKWSQRLILLGD